MAVLFNHLAGTGEQRGGYFKAERLGCLEIDHQLEFGRLLDRQIGGLGALEDFSRVMADQAKGRSEAGSIADQPAGSGKFTPRIDRRNGTARCQRHELLAPAAQERIRADDQRASMQLDKGGEGGVCPAQIRLRPPAESKTERLLPARPRHEAAHSRMATQIVRPG
jgi:hypothetical protein